MKKNQGRPHDTHSNPPFVVLTYGLKTRGLGAIRGQVCLVVFCVLTLFGRCSLASMLELCEIGLEPRHRSEKLRHPLQDHISFASRPLIVPRSRPPSWTAELSGRDSTCAGRLFSSKDSLKVRNVAAFATFLADFDTDQGWFKNGMGDVLPSASLNSHDETASNGSVEGIRRGGGGYAAGPSGFRRNARGPSGKRLFPLRTRDGDATSGRGWSAARRR